MTRTLKRTGRARARVVANASLVLTLTGLVGLAALSPTAALATESSMLTPSNDSGGATPELPEAPLPGGVSEAPPAPDDASLGTEVADELTSATLDAAPAALPPAELPPTIPGGTSLEPVTVAWAGGNDPALQQWQVDRTHIVDNADGSGHWLDFDDLKITVSQTAELVNQAVTVEIEGMPGPTDKPMYIRSLYNFVQVMQCWGPDPRAADFAKTCQWGGYSGSANNRSGVELLSKIGAGDGIMDRPSYVAPEGTPEKDTYTDDGVRRLSISQFQTVTGQVAKPFEVTNPGNANEPFRFLDGSSAFYTTQTTNELPLVRIGSDGSGRGLFEAQNGASAPHLGCGNPTTGGERCWLVVVPRGQYSGTLNDPDRICAVPGHRPGQFGEKIMRQSSSPLSADCAFWSNRIVVPLDFQPVVQACAPGTAERLVVGSETVSVVLGSWQGAICAEGGPVLSYVPNPGSASKGQLLSGRSELAFLTSGIDPATHPGAVGRTIEYAPIANGALSVAFVYDRAPEGEVRQMNLTPRLVAKLLTSSYRNQVSNYRSEDVLYEHVAVNPAGLMADPEFKAVNPDFPVNLGWDGGLPYLALIGPHGEDVLRVLWAWVQADTAAQAWLGGAADEYGMRINPYYLPSSHPGALGGGIAEDLAHVVVEWFPKADQTVSPVKREQYGGTGIDALMWAPYQGSFRHAAAGVLRGTIDQQHGWDAERGEWAKAGPLDPALGAGKFLIAITDLATATSYGLATAALQPPNRAGVYVTPDAASLTAAITARDATAPSAPDFGAMPETAYPLTFTVYGAADATLHDTKPEAAAELAVLLDYAAGPGQTPGLRRGELPLGYVPLTEAQRAETARIAGVLRSGSPVKSPGTPPASTPPGTAPVSSGGATPAQNVPAANQQPGVRALPAANGGDTAATASLAQIAVGGSLLAGLAGLLATPFLMRRRPL